MKGEYTKRKLKKFTKIFREATISFCREFKRFFVKRSVKQRNFTVISNNCWAGRLYQYLDMPYLSPTVGLYFFAPDYIKFVSDLKHYLDIPLKFIKAEESKYFEELKIRNQLDKPIGIIDDVEIVFLHYKTEAEALEKWNRRKARVNFEKILFKFSRMDLCTEKEMQEFDSLPYKNKVLINNQLPLKYGCEVYWDGKTDENGYVVDTDSYPGTVNLKKILRMSRFY